MTRRYRRHTAAPALLELLDERPDAGNALTVVETARHLGCSRGLVYVLLRSGELAGFRELHRGQWRIRVALTDLTRYLAQSRQAAS
jgi:excisionase family DNA binding protein